jgi:hypothetical protein
MLNNHSINRNFLPIIIISITLLTIFILGTFYLKFTAKLFTIQFFFFLPTFLIILYDKSSDKTLLQSVFLANLTGVFYRMPTFLAMIFYSKRQDLDLISLLDFEDLLLIYWISFAGALVAFLVPPLFFTLKMENLKNIRKKLLHKINKLNAQWPLED